MTCPTTCLKVPFAGRSAAACGLGTKYQFTLGRSLDYPAYYVTEDAGSIKAIGMTKQTTIPSVTGSDDIQEMFAALADVWAQSHSCDPTPTYLYVDFGEGVPPGLAMLIPSKEGWAILKALKATEVNISDLSVNR